MSERETSLKTPKERIAVEVLDEVERLLTESEPG